MGPADAQLPAAALFMEANSLLSSFLAFDYSAKYLELLHSISSVLARVPVIFLHGMSKTMRSACFFHRGLDFIELKEYYHEDIIPRISDHSPRFSSDLML